MIFNFKINHGLVLIISLLFFSCSEDEKYPEFRIKNAYATVPLEGADTIAAYMSLTNLTNKNISLSKISCRGSEKSSLHDIQVDPDKGIISMNQLDILILNPRETIHLKPGGRHIMIMGLTDPFSFSDNVLCLLDIGSTKKFPISFTIR